jgi:outer membrane biosynthesis protein TonB
VKFEKIDKTLVASIALHVLVIGWGIISFSTRSLEAKPQESMPIDIISADQLSQLTKGSKTGDKTKQAPLVDKIADAKPVDDQVGKITEKKEVVTPTAQEPPPKPMEKPVEKKPDPPKPVAQEKPKEQPKPVEKKPDPPKVDPIAEALKKDEAKQPPKPKQEAKAAPQPPPKPKQEAHVFDQSKIAALLDKREPTRQASTGSQLNPQASLGTSTGTAAKLSQSELDALRARLAQLWNLQAGADHPEELIVEVRLRLKPDRTLAVPPEVLSRGTSTRFMAARDAAMRAVFQGQPFNMLQSATYDQWKDMIVTFDPRQMYGGG